jgi:hypothetical protein
MLALIFLRMGRRKLRRRFSRINVDHENFQHIEARHYRVSEDKQQNARSCDVNYLLHKPAECDPGRGSDVEERQCSLQTCDFDGKVCKVVSSVMGRLSRFAWRR